MKLFRKLSVIVALVAVPSWGSAQEPPAADRPLAQFDVAPDGDALLLPVTLAGKTYLFALDTGAAVTVYDRSLPLGPARGQGTGNTPNGDVSVVMYDAPKASLGPLAFDPGPFVAGADLGRLREATRHDIRGLVGMDFLGRHVVRIDFDAGKVTLLRTAGSAPGEPVILSHEGQGPCVGVDLPGGSREAFVIDTGCLRFGKIKQDLAAALSKAGKAQKVGDTLNASISGTTSQAKWRIDSLSLSGFCQRDRVLTDSRDNLLGLGCLSRFVVTLDFPDRMMFLKKGRAFDRPSAVDRSGLHLLRVGGRTVVHAVDPGSPAADCGIRADDVIGRVGGEDAGRLRLFQLRQALSEEGKTLSLTVRRGGDDRAVWLALGRGGD